MCRSLEFTGGIGFSCNCGKDKYDGEILKLQSNVSNTQDRILRLNVEYVQLRDALSEILHLESGSLSDAQEIAYSALQKGSNVNGKT